MQKHGLKNTSEIDDADEMNFGAIIITMLALALAGWGAWELFVFILKSLTL